MDVQINYSTRHRKRCENAMFYFSRIRCFIRAIDSIGPVQNEGSTTGVCLTTSLEARANDDPCTTVALFLIFLPVPVSVPYGFEFTAFTSQRIWMRVFKNGGLYPPHRAEPLNYYYVWLPSLPSRSATYRRVRCTACVGAGVPSAGFTYAARVRAARGEKRSDTCAVQPRAGREKQPERARWKRIQNVYRTRCTCEEM